MDGSRVPPGPVHDPPPGASCPHQHTQSPLDQEGSKANGLHDVLQREWKTREYVLASTTACPSWTGTTTPRNENDGEPGRGMVELAQKMLDDWTTVPCPLPVKASQKPVLRLSWPKAVDGRRSIVGKSSTARKRKRDPHVNDARIVSVSQRDVEMHYHLASSTAHGNSPPFLDIPLEWSPVQLEARSQDLFQHFHRTASKSLPILGHNPLDLGHVLIRLALASSTPSATAVFQSLLAFSALHRHGVYGQAVELKISAIKALSAAAPPSRAMTAAEAMQHVAAGMMISSFEVHQSTCTSGEWTCYLRGVKDVIRVAGLDKMAQDDSDLAMLLDWVYYHDVLARFSMQHWRKGSTWDVQSIRSGGSNDALALIDLLSDVCETVSPTRLAALSSAEAVDSHKPFLKILDWRIRTATTSGGTDAPPPLILELYQLVTLVYLNRTCEKLLNQRSKTQEHIDRGFAILSQLPSCDRQFPIFILGCEARSDDHRAVILDLIARTEKGVSSRSFNHVRLLLQAVWAQDDLGEGSNIRYWDRLSSVIGRCRILPSFV